MIKLKLKQLLLLTIISLSVSLFGKGSDELIKDNSGEAELTVSSENRFGKIVYIFQGLDLDEEVSFVVVKVGSSYYDQGGNLLEDQPLFNTTFGFMALNSTKSLVIGGEDSTIGHGQVVVDEVLFSDISIGHEVEVSIDCAIDKVNLTVWTISSSGKVYNIATAVTPNFFNGEKEFFDRLFTSTSTLSYSEKLIFFMSTFFIEETVGSNSIVTGIIPTTERTYFIEETCKLFNDTNAAGIPAINTLINSSNFNEIYSDLLKNQNKFKVAFASHFTLNNEDVYSKDSNMYPGRDAKLPFLDINSKSFDSIYGDSNPYIALYLNYISKENDNYNKKSKPLLHYLINKKVNENSDDAVGFDYNQFRQVTLEEGLSISESALRYMTWAVEYTPGSASELENNNSENNVYYDNASSISDWTYNIDLDINKRTSNYFNGTIKPFTLPKNIEATSPLGKLYLKGLITSPFSNSAGNPVAYSAMGIDTPKTFNYKMVEQNRARKWLLNKYFGNYYIMDNFPELTNGIFKTTNATKEFYNSYVDEIDLYKEDGVDLKIVNNIYDIELPALSKDIPDIRPFLPGIRSKSKDMYSKNINSPFHPNKIAGVDSLGILMGSLSMADIDGNFLNVFNTAIDEKLDEYNRSEPQFHVTEDNNQLEKSYRFTKADIERSSIFLPDLSMARPGDLLVNFINEEPRIGIIISADFTGLNETSAPEDYMKNILVVSINSGFRMANVGVWLSENNLFGGFVTPGKEKTYHLRRMLVKPTDESGNDNSTGTFATRSRVTDPVTILDHFEFFDTELLELDIEMDFMKIQNNRSSKYVESHWIPNTGEILGINKITIKGNYGDDVFTQLKEDDREITILPPFDEYYQEHVNYAGSLSAEVGSNIYQNKGDGLKFYAKMYDNKTEKSEYILLATFKLKNSGLVEKGESPYLIEYSDDVFISSTEGKTKPGMKLFVDGKTLVFQTKDKIYREFGVRPINNKIRPGDDFLLRFAKQDNLEVEGISKESDFLAIYDKKLLWRANLFIDTNDNDWNKHNPWNAPVEIDNDSNTGIQTANHYNEFCFKLASTDSANNDEVIWYGNNQWNKIMKTNSEAEDFKMNGSWEDLSDLTDGDGGQVVEFPSAVYNNSEYSDGLVADYMVYNFIRTTSPFLYYSNMMKQYRAMELRATGIHNAYTYALIDYIADKSELHKAVLDLITPKYNLYYESLDSDTLLPPNVIKVGVGYITPEKALTLWSRYDRNAPKPGAEDALNLENYTDHPFIQPPKASGPLQFIKDGENILNTVPGFEDYKITGTIPPGEVYSNKQAGVDCGGLIYMAEAYNGSKYLSYKSKRILADIAARYVHDVGSGTSGYDVNHNNLYEIMKESDYNEFTKSKPENRKRLIPGDIMFFPGYHVAMVQDVDIESGNRDVNVQKIFLIESTHHSGITNAFGGNGLWGVGNRNILSYYHKDDDGHKNWIIGRLKHEN